MAGLLEEASRDVMRGRSIDQLPLLDEEKQTDETLKRLEDCQ